jgi:hypothetical protein
LQMEQLGLRVAKVQYLVSRLLLQGHPLLSYER